MYRQEEKGRVCEKIQIESGGRVKMHRKEVEGEGKGTIRKWVEGEKSQKESRGREKRHRKEVEGW
jgi:hypothetical protein